MLLSSLSLAQKVKNTKLKCKDFKVGKFEGFAGAIKVLIERDKNFQYEILPEGQSKYKVTWSSECEYVLELMETTVSSIKEAIPIGEKYFITIIETTEHSYVYECRTLENNYVTKNTIRKIK